MSEAYYNNKLYPLQDKVLKEIGRLESKLYLTGGTVVGRFLLHHRYSDDLDFFLNRSDYFHDEVDKVIEVVKTCGSVEISFRDTDFVRIFVTHENARLKVEFVNDVGYRVGVPTMHPLGFQMDTWQNILTNKLTALSRLAGKDYVDILFLSLKYEFNWEEFINHAKQKDAWIAEHEVANFLLNFDLRKLNEVSFPKNIDPSVINVAHFTTLAKDAFNGFNNSLYGIKLF